MKLIVIFNDGVPDLELQKIIQNKINEFHKDNLVLFGNSIEVVIVPKEKNSLLTIIKNLFKKSPN